MWKSYKLKEFLSFYSTNSLSRSNLNYENGNIKNIHYGDIHTKFPSIINCETEEIPYINLDIDSSRIKEDSFCKDSDLIIADASENYDDIGKAIELINVGNQKIVAGLHTILARDTEDITVSGFKGYLFQTDNLKKQIKIITNGISVLGISKNNLKNLYVNIPSKEEQEKIVRFLFLIDRKIDLLEKTLVLYQKIKKHILEQIFANLKCESESLDKVTFYQEGPGVRNYQYTKEGIKLLNVGNFVENELILENTDRYISEEEAYGKYKHFLVDEGDLLIACSGIKAEYFDEKITFAKKEHLPLCMNTSTMRFKTLNENKLNLNYLKWYFQTVMFKKQIFGVLTGSAQFNFGPTHLKYLKVLIPPIEQQIVISNFLDFLKNHTDKLSKEIYLMKEYKKGLLQKMFV